MKNHHWSPFSLFCLLLLMISVFSSSWRTEGFSVLLDSNPLWLRRLNYFQCAQSQTETAAQFWSCTRELASQCKLVEFKVPDDIEVMELIRNVHAPQLRTKFLDVKDPKVPALLQIAANWQRDKDVSKTMDTTAKAAKAAKASISSYKTHLLIFCWFCS